MDTTSIIIIIVVAILLGSIMFKYSAIESFLFNKGDGEFFPIGDIAMKVCIATGAIAGATGLIYSAINDESIFSVGFSSIWGIICNGLPYVAFAVISFCVYMICTVETTVVRMILRSLFLVVSCVLGIIGGVIASIIAIVLIIFAMFISILFKTSPFGGAGSSSKESNNDYDATITDENGYERKLRDVGCGRYQDDKGDYWRDSGLDRVERE